MRNYKYSWTKQYNVDAQVAGEIIQSLPERTAEALLGAAEKRSNPLHALFEWDDSRAAQQYRLVQARVMINSLRVEIVSNDAEPTHVTAFISRSDKVGYVSTLEADDEELGAAEKSCWLQMKAFKQRWKGLQFARTVVESINHIEVQQSRRKTPRKAG